jgi:DNA-binding response OmpR family regulator
MVGKILIVDDEPQVARSVRRVLEDAEFSVDVANSGQDAIAQMARDRPDLVVLDIIMPDINGIEVCRRIRADPFLARIPVLFLTAKGRPQDIVDGLDAGGDDYCTKPFDVTELPARVRALLRRSPGGPLDTASDYITVGNLRLHTTRPEVDIDGRQVQLTAMEQRLLHYLMVHQGQPISTHHLLEDVWEYPPGVGNPKLVHVHMVNLRAKLEDNPDQPEFIRNVRGRGYLVTT